MITMTISAGIALVIAVVFAVTFLFWSAEVVPTGAVAIVERFGRASRLLRPGLNFRWPLIEGVSYYNTNREARELEFQAITKDQAAVKFSATLVIEPSNATYENMLKVAYTFAEEAMFENALKAAVEGAVRSFVASKHQAEVLGLRAEIVSTVKNSLDKQLDDWGWNLSDLQVNDIAFDETVMASMTQVVSAKNALTAAEFEGQATYVRATKQAEASGQAIIISAKAEATAAQERGKGLAMFREEVSKGIRDSAEDLKKKGVDPRFVLLSMWTETIQHMAEHGKGNTIFLDASIDAMDRSFNRLLSGKPPYQAENA